MNISLSRSVQETLLQDAMNRASALAAPYQGLVQDIAAITTVIRGHQDEARRQSGKLWDAFKQALNIATNAGHSQESMRIGLEIACDRANIPSGSYRSYIPTLINMHGEVMARSLSLAEALKLSIGDARKRYRKVTDEERARQRVNEALRSWNAEELETLAAVVLEADTEAALELVEIAREHAEDAEESHANT